MTLQQFFDMIQANPNFSLYFFLGIPAIALVLGWVTEPDSSQSPWNYLFAVLVYAICIPGIFAVTLNIYFFFWERRSIMDTQLMIQFFPILSMVVTIAIIRRFVNLDDVPGFDKLTGFMLIIGVILTLMWVLDRTHIYAISFMPFYIVLLVIVGGILLIRYGLKQLIS
ncbi:MAG: hypothetical protein IPO72_10570 [Saprospiraceae bacterium]|nr:hypothetical protein [Candidatus Vicinibacter affinis]MBK7800458.1 hypothetical protein [Candidatus Vicinibacter affinis]MBK8644282.1 hypothetical protein [Candidatus Vicinibacter affinis]MBK9641704.1 hypothetical protein [Candidatus Vicinibacter affinis]